MGTVFVEMSFDKASRDEDNILDQVYESKYVRSFIMFLLILYISFPIYIVFLLRSYQ